MVGDDWRCRMQHVILALPDAVLTALGASDELLRFSKINLITSVAVQTDHMASHALE